MKMGGQIKERLLRGCEGDKEGEQGENIGGARRWERRNTVGKGI